MRAEWLHTCDLKAVADAYASFHQDDMHADLLAIAVPTLLIAAGRGDVIRPEEFDEIVGLTPDIQAMRVPAAGHMIPWDDETGFFAALGDFLDGELSERRVFGRAGSHSERVSAHKALAARLRGQGSSPPPHAGRLRT